MCESLSLIHRITWTRKQLNEHWSNNFELWSVWWTFGVWTDNPWYSGWDCLFWTRRAKQLLGPPKLAPPEERRSRVHLSGSNLKRKSFKDMMHPFKSVNVCFVYLESETVWVCSYRSVQGRCRYFLPCQLCHSWVEPSRCYNDNGIDHYTPVQKQHTIKKKGETWFI